MYGFDREVIPYLETDINFNGEKGGIYIAKVTLDGPLYKSAVKERRYFIKNWWGRCKQNNCFKKIYIYKKTGRCG